MAKLPIGRLTESVTFLSSTPPAIPVISLTSVGTVASAVTGTPHGLRSGDYASIRGAVPVGYNTLSAQVTVISATQFSYDLQTTIGSNYRELVLADQPAHYWRLNETSGPTAVDGVGGVNGTLSGGVAFNAPGAIADGDPAMLFTGTGKMQTAAPVGWTSNSTLELWLQHTQDTGVIASTGTSGTGDYVFVRQITPTLVQLYVDYASTADNTIEFTVGAGLGDGHWHHVVLVLRSSGTIAELFINGIAAVPNRALVTAIAHTRNFILGFDPALSGEYWTGGFDEVAIYPRVLSPADIAAHYAARLSPPVTGTITVTFQSDSQGGQPDDWYDAGQAFAYIEPLNAAERLAVSAVAATVNYRAVVHYRTTITPQMKLRWLRYQESDPRELAIFGVYPHPEPAYAHRFLVLECGELA